MNHTPTPEQAAVVDAAAAGDDLVVEAGAGTGKTSTLKLVAARLGRRRGVYVAYNRAIATDAQRSFPSTVICKTAHSLAYGSVGRQYASRLKGPRIPAQRAAQILGIREPVQLDKDRPPIAPQHLARMVGDTLQRFCYSADQRIERKHVPLVNGIDTDSQRAELARYLVPIAQKAWDTEIVPFAGRLRFSHDMYLKIWALSEPQLGADYVLLDEAQDSNPCVAGLVTGQRAQRIWVGDRSQAIYGWRGAVDAMANAPGTRLMLSQSFRFGPAIADEANKWLAILRAPLRLRGFDRIDSEVCDQVAPDAVLCRSNGEAVRQVMSYRMAGARVALVGGGKEIIALAEAADELRTIGSTQHAELCMFGRWSEVQDYVEQDAAGSDLKVAVRLIDTYGARQIVQVLSDLVPEDRATVVISTAHKGKGREWERVQIADDFREPVATEENPRPKLPREDAMLAYVSVTRARHVLGREGLKWVDHWAPDVVALAGQDREARRPSKYVIAEPSALQAKVDEIVGRPDTRATNEMPAEHADEAPPPASVPLATVLCGRCGAPKCLCDPATAKAWSELTGIPAGAR